MYPVSLPSFSSSRMLFWRLYPGNIAHQRQFRGTIGNLVAAPQATLYPYVPLHSSPQSIPCSPQSFDSAIYTHSPISTSHHAAPKSPYAPLAQICELGAREGTTVHDEGEVGSGSVIDRGTRSCHGIVYAIFQLYCAAYLTLFAGFESRSVPAVVT